MDLSFGRKDSSDSVLIPMRLLSSDPFQKIQSQITPLSKTKLEPKLNKI